MISYYIQFKGEIWDIENSDYQNYFTDITPFTTCVEVELYQYGSAYVEVINNEPIIQEFTGKFEFVHNNKNIGYWEIPSENSHFELICLGLISIYNTFNKQKEEGIPFKLDTL
ncbi:hypothetical protein H8356DRAFT_1036630 [Neocallimastix lanati (nom. inval.)]|nr:hypothetical protein H8356DRAFT_1036630 [Neocallimastix sp. JGI-2020a]